MEELSPSKQHKHAPWEEIVSASADPAGRSEALRHELALPFRILCDTQRLVIQQWDLYNAREKGGIAKPAVFVIHCDRMVRYSHLDALPSVYLRQRFIRILDATAGQQSIRCKVYVPRPSDFLRALRSKNRH